MTSLLRAVEDGLTEPGLIRVDRRLLGVLGIVALLFGGMVALGLHSSSIGAWNARLIEDNGRGVDPGHVWGRPLDIRSDEWMVSAPFILNQLQRGLPDRNPA